jgi:hypothetical protein
MHPAILNLALVALAFFGQGQELQDRPAPKGQLEQPPRRCGYLGRWGSFHLIGKAGSAAYTLGDNDYVADLRLTREDGGYWYYSPSDGDPFTAEWALASKPDACGMYPVWRAVGGRWVLYERARAWGQGLGREVRSTHTGGPSIESRVSDLERRVDKLEGRPKEGSAP